MKWKFVAKGAFIDAEKKSEWYEYECSKCGMRVRVPDIVSKSSLPVSCSGCGEEER